MGIEIIFLILAVLVVAFGIGVVVLNRRREGVQQPPARPVAPPTAAGSTLLMVSHDERLAPRFDRSVRMEDITILSREAPA